MGHFSMEKSLNPGSVLGGNQQFERIKTLEAGTNKPETAAKLLDRAAPAHTPKFRALLDNEAKELTTIGNTLRIRHSETNKEPVQTSEQVDYLFHRLFSFLLLLLRATQRASAQRTELAL